MFLYFLIFFSRPVRKVRISIAIVAINRVAIITINRVAIITINRVAIITINIIRPVRLLRVWISEGLTQADS